jgi:hypothetical protein
MAGMPLLPLDEVLFCLVPSILQFTSPVPAALVQTNFISGGRLMIILEMTSITRARENP